ncbi:restriction endonuclease subunit S [Pelodictyon phaeoclathratiforme]|jgi:type I restriction enzyme S subunit|uniref:Restriction modification system DNA specificity domain n=1 Tax=Pelodictyon phaeoclathratiforme (strain DSM 5477 / BU-1) TaxID=324925 RepID=B4SA10_PELPB|nr:restriction endonuclease subunit S [Pelodictyon phaeoclathratiforme]ACF43706.1 restriction modification system DNA specificity domain [Pelodictyon phaeoclathratiforme BU-1]MBV5330645.1 restriction endonuclease subunit S [Chlorobium sp.]
MKTVELQQVTTIIAGQSPESSTYNSIADGLPFFQGKADFQDKFPKVRIWCNSAKRKEADPGDILMSVRAPVGSVNICNQKCIIGRGLSAIRPDANLNNYFLYYYLKCNEKNVASLGTGSTFQAITQTTLKRLDVPLPPLDDQIRSATLLSKVENLIFRRREQLKQLDELLKSVFLEMFGDPVRNEMGWEMKRMDEISDSRLGKMRDKKFITGNHLRKYIGNSNVQWFRFKLDDLEEMDFDERERVLFALMDGDLLICEGGDIGRCAIWRSNLSECYFQKAIHRVRLHKSQAIPEYLQYVMLFFSLYNGFKNVTCKATISHLTGEKLKETLIPLPSLELQNRFSTIVKKVEKIKITYTHSFINLESLYGILSQKAFKGELDFLQVSPVEGNVS